uniref:L1 transposable element RRM domain-containing protein n=1 Tax=Latimeria chalumnae TaxID=7897 RepID=H3AQL5_LATCH
TVLEEKIEENYEREQVKGKRIKILEQRAEDSENWAHHNNVQISGVPEGVEKGDIVAFLQDLLKNTLGVKAGNCAHRALRPRPAPEECPRQIIFKMLRWQDKEMIIRTAQEKKGVTWNNSRLFFNQDFSKDLQMRRMEYIPIKKDLFREGVKFILYYPTVLKEFSIEGNIMNY